MFNDYMQLTQYNLDVRERQEKANRDLQAREIKNKRKRK